MKSTGAQSSCELQRLSQCFNSLAPGRPGCHFKTAIFNLVLLIGIFTSSKDNTLRWMPKDLTDDKSTLVQVMAWCRQATNHYLSQCWPSSMPPYGVTRPQWVKVTYNYPGDWTSWRPLLGLQYWHPLIFVKPLQLIWRSGAHRFICGYPIIKWVAMT